MQAVGDRFEAGRLVDHVLRGGELAAIMQPTRHIEFVPLVIRQLEVGERSIGGLMRRFRELPGDLRHPLAVAVGVGRLGVDRPGHHVDDGVEQVLLGLQHPPQIQCHGRVR